MMKQPLLYVQWFTLALCMMALNANSQPYQFSQFYNTFQLLNPSYTGITGQKYRIGTISRLQWVGVPNQSVIPYQTYALYGHWIFGHPQSQNPNMRSLERNRNSFYSVGFALTQNNQANGLLKINSAITSLSWIGRLGELTYLSGGAEFNYNYVRLSEYVPVSDYLQGLNNAVPGDQVQYPNLSLGLTLVHERVWFGASIKDVLSTPAGTTFYTQNKKYYEQVNLHGGFSKVLRDTEGMLMLTSAFSFKTWQNFRQLEYSLGILQSYSTGYSWSTSLAYRGYPIQEQSLSNSDAMIFIMAFNSISINQKSTSTDNRKSLLGNTSISISSDFYSFQFGSAFSTWEISLIFNAPYTKNKLVYCEDYLHGPMAEQITRNFYSGLPPYSNGKGTKSSTKQGRSEEEGIKRLPKKRKSGKK
jgi:hypothetical protein